MTLQERKQGWGTDAKCLSQRWNSNKRTLNLCVCRSCGDLSISRPTRHLAAVVTTSKYLSELHWIWLLPIHDRTLLCLSSIDTPCKHDCLWRSAHSLHGMK